MEVTPHSSFPLLEEALGDELFASQEDREVVEMQREIWKEIRRDLPIDLRGLERVSAAELKKHLHRIRGYAATASLLRLSEILKAWETSSDPALMTADFLPEAIRASECSIKEIEQRYPHLLESSQKPG